MLAPVDFKGPWNKLTPCAFSRLVNSGPCKMLTVVAILAGPILVATILMIAVFEIKDAWDRHRLR
jgi:hypothetical protein